MPNAETCQQTTCSGDRYAFLLVRRAGLTGSGRRGGSGRSGLVRTSSGTTARDGMNPRPGPVPHSASQTVRARTARQLGQIRMTDLTRIDDGPVASVYSCYRAGVPVALKVFPNRFDKRTMSAFKKEQAKLSAVRRTRSILMVDGVETMPTGESALRMELCAQSLAALVERVGPLSAVDVAGVGRAMAEALAAAHSVGVVHGGLSPNNVLFREN